MVLLSLLLEFDLSKNITCRGVKTGVKCLFSKSKSCTTSVSVSNSAGFPMAAIIVMTTCSSAMTRHPNSGFQLSTVSKMKVGAWSGVQSEIRLLFFSFFRIQRVLHSKVTSIVRLTMQMSTGRILFS